MCQAALPKKIKKISLGTKIWAKSWETLESNGTRTGCAHDPSHSTHTHTHPEENESDPRVSGWDEEGQRRNENKPSVTYKLLTNEFTQCWLRPPNWEKKNSPSECQLKSDFHIWNLGPTVVTPSIKDVKENKSRGGGVDDASAIKWTSALMCNASSMWEFRRKRDEKGKSNNVDFQWMLVHPIMTRLEIALTGEQTCHRPNLLIYGDPGSSFTCTH